MYHYSYGLFRKLAIHKCTCVCKCLGLSMLSTIQLFSSCVNLLCILLIHLCAIFLPSEYMSCVWFVPYWLQAGQTDQMWCQFKYLNKVVTVPGTAESGSLTCQKVTVSKVQRSRIAAFQLSDISVRYIVSFDQSIYCEILQYFSAFNFSLSLFSLV